MVISTGDTSLQSPWRPLTGTLTGTKRPAETALESDQETEVMDLRIDGIDGIHRSLSIQYIYICINMLIYIYIYIYT
jgi:hypothetical protein